MKGTSSFVKSCEKNSEEEDERAKPKFVGERKKKSEPVDLLARELDVEPGDEDCNDEDVLIVATRHL